MVQQGGKPQCSPCRTVTIQGRQQMSDKNPVLTFFCAGLKESAPQGVACGHERLDGHSKCWQHAGLMVAIGQRGNISHFHKGLQTVS